MSKKQQNRNMALTAESLKQNIHAAETVDEQTLLTQLERHEGAMFVINLRLRAARLADDAPRVKELEADLETETKYRAYFADRLSKISPAAKIPKYDFRDVEAQVVVNDYLQFTRLKRNAKLQYDAAIFTGNKTHADMAQMEVTRAMKYLAFYKPKFDRIARQAK